MQSTSHHRHSGLLSDALPEEADLKRSALTLLTLLQINGLNAASGFHFFLARGTLMQAAEMILDTQKNNKYFCKQPSHGNVNLAFLLLLA